MRLLADVPASGLPVAWTFIHIWRINNGVVAEQRACRDDMSLLEQLLG